MFIKLCCSYFFVDWIYFNNGCKFEKVFVAAVLYKFRLKFICGQFLSTCFPVWDNLCGEIEDMLTIVHFSYSLNLRMWFLYCIWPSLASWCCQKKPLMKMKVDFILLVWWWVYWWGGWRRGWWNWWRTWSINSSG